MVKLLADRSGHGQATKRGEIDGAGNLLHVELEVAEVFVWQEVVGARAGKVARIKLGGTGESYALGRHGRRRLEAAWVSTLPASSISISTFLLMAFQLR